MRGVRSTGLSGIIREMAGPAMRTTTWLFPKGGISKGENFDFNNDFLRSKIWVS